VAVVPGATLDDLLIGGEARFPLPAGWQAGSRAVGGLDIFDDRPIVSTRIFWRVMAPQPGMVVAARIRPRFGGLVRPVWWVRGNGEIGTVDAGDPVDVPVLSTLGSPPTSTLGDLETWLRSNTIFELFDVDPSRSTQSVADVPPMAARMVRVVDQPGLIQLPA